MVGKTERVILVKGDGTKWYEQAIFIVNQDTAAEGLPIDFVAEAEKIICDFNLKRISTKNETVIVTPQIAPKKRRANFALGFLMTLACLVIVAVLIFGLMS